MMPSSATFILRILLPLAVLNGGGWILKVSATSCTPETDSFCPTTLFSTGVCNANANCTCVTGYSPASRGCRKDLETPSIELFDEKALPYGSEGANFTLVCTPNVMGYMNYIWRLEGSIVSGSGASLFVEPSAAGSPHGYTCQYTDGDQISSESDNFDINIVALSDLSNMDPAIESRIQGMPTTILNETLLTLVCAPVMKVDHTFAIDGSLISAMVSGDTYTGEVNVFVDNSDVFCTVSYDDGDSTLMYFASETVPSISDNIPGVHIAEGDRYSVDGGSISLTCAFDEDDFLASGFTITWEWFLNDTKDNSLTTQSITLNTVASSTHHGEWKCTAQYEDQPTRESATIFLQVDFPYTVSLSIFPEIPVSGGYLEIRCDVQSTLTAADFTYSWTAAMSVLENFDDNALFFNDVNSSDTGSYTCAVSIDRIARSMTITVPDPVSFTDSPAPTLSINSTEDLLEFTELYQLKCTINSSYGTPGIEIAFLQDGVEVAAGTDDEYFVVGNITDRNFTCTSTFNMQSSGESNSITVSFAVFDTVQVENASEVVITTMAGIVNTEITLLCEVGLLPGVFEDPSYKWLDADLNEVGTGMMLDLNVTTEGDVIYFCMAELGSRTQRSSNNVTVTGHLLETPVMSLLNSVSGDNLNFAETYYLRCEVGAFFASFELEYEFIQDGAIIEVDFNNTFQIPNDIIDREYTCLILLQSQTSAASNAINISFEVFESVEIKNTENIVIMSVDGIVNTLVNLVCDVDVVLEVAEDPEVTWFDLDANEVSSDVIFEANVTEEAEVTYFCVADLGSHSMRSATNVTVISHELAAPVLSIIVGMVTEGLDFEQSHQLHCAVPADITSLFAIRYTFLKDGIDDVFNSSSDTYDVTNDVVDRDYGCEALYLTAVSPASNTLTLSFAVFDSVEIQDTDGDGLSTVDAIVNTTFSLVSSVSLLPGIPTDAAVVWYDDQLVVLDMDPTLVVNITEGLNATYFFEAELGSHTLRSHNVTIIGHVLYAPVLSFTDHANSSSLNFSQTHYLQCALAMEFSRIELDYEYSRDGVVVHTSPNDTYAISNDVIDREYTCDVSHQTVTSPISNSVNASFAVFNTMNISDILQCHVRSEIEPTYQATLNCDVLLKSDVPNDVTYTWQEGNATNVSFVSTYSFFLMDDVDISVTCRAELGSHVEMYSRSYVVIAANVTVPCSAASFRLSLTLLVLILIVSAYYRSNF